jgi:hypothetical protein
MALRRKDLKRRFLQFLSGMSQKIGYRDVVSAIVRKEEETVGELAVRRAGNLEEIEVEEGEIKFSREPDGSTVRRLIENYSEFQKDGSKAIAREAMRETLEPDFQLDLPADIVPTKLKQERFVRGF